MLMHEGSGVYVLLGSGANPQGEAQAAPEFWRYCGAFHSSGSDGPRAPRISVLRGSPGCLADARGRVARGRVAGKDGLG